MVNNFVDYFLEVLEDASFFNSIMMFSNLIIVEISTVLCFFTSCVVAYTDMELNLLSSMSLFVYIGAVAMLMLFTIMLIDIAENEDESVDVDFGSIVFVTIFTLIFNDESDLDALSLVSYGEIDETYADTIAFFSFFSEISIISDLYEFTLLFVILSLVLLSSLMGIIVIVLQVSHNSI
jgi:NADH:ubiquinone oxidoreductase subunit 6 (subunit J)